MMPDWVGSNPYQQRLTQALRDQGVKVRRASPRRGPAPIINAWLAAGRPRVVHLHWTHAFLGSDPNGPGWRDRKRFTGQLAVLRWLGVRIVWTLHNLGAHDGARSPVEMAVHRDLVHRCHAIIAHCQVAVDAAVGAYALQPADRARFRVIPHGSYIGTYDESVSREDARAQLGLDAEARVFAFVGALRAYKGVEELIAAFKALPDPAARLIVAGQAKVPVAKQLHAAAAGDERIVLRTERVPESEMGVVLGAADAVVLPFRDVLTSGSAILAMGFGRPVIAPRLGCLPETLPEQGTILYDPTDPEALARSLRTALECDLSAMGQHNRAAALRLDWAEIARDTIAAYQAGPAARPDD
jgi:glycosyltransferase involved in cell wall biosynthesis